jgi:hypothetical protein
MELRAPESAVFGALRAGLFSMLWTDWLGRRWLRHPRPTEFGLR